MANNASPLLYDLEVTYYASGDIWARYIATIKVTTRVFRLQHLISRIEAEECIDKRIAEHEALFLIEHKLSSTFEGPVMLGERTDKRYANEEEEQEEYQRSLDQFRLEKHRQRTERAHKQRGFESDAEA